MNIIRYFNKYFFNRLILKFAGSSFGFFAKVHHTGRKSGKQFQTPIIAVPFEKGFMVALTYGREVDWYKNIQSMSAFDLEWCGNKYKIYKIISVNSKPAKVNFPFILRVVLYLLKTKYFVKFQY